MTNQAEVKVTVVCLAYNHGRFIRRALDSVLEQVTDFPFEVIVHDDASTDNTQEIILEYARGSEKIIPIFESDNCFQRGVDYYETIYKQVHGKYIAFCECDDWWCDKDKLQKQYDYMEKNDDCSLCVHGVKRFNGAEQRYCEPQCPSEIARDFSTNEIIEGDGGLFGTNSMFFRAALYLLPEEYRSWGVGDYPRTIFLSLNGRVHYEPELMSVYQVFADGSWSNRMRDSSFAMKQESMIVDGLERVDKLTGGKFNRAISYRKAVGYLEYVSKFGSYQDLLSPKGKECLDTLPLTKRIKYQMRNRFPSFYNKVKRATANMKQTEAE